ncbi:MAG TPA: EthD family reductase [Acidimicrobiales bacterium]|nr:EthD family reductase [Acidimicrobiales bacterium]
MVKLTVLFGHPEDPEAFEEYYANQHLPLAAKIPNVQRFESGRLGAVDGGESPYHRMAELWFESAERMAEAVSSPEGQVANGDIRNFATGGATFLVSEVAA